MGKSLIMVALTCVTFLSCGGDSGIIDFELPNQRPGSLGILRRLWTKSSQPADGIHSHRNIINNYVWYNPLEQVPFSEIYPEVELNANVPQRTNVLRMDLFSDPGEPEPHTSRWGGVMRALSPRFFEQSQTKFVEIMVQGNKGRLHLDFGAISEDVIPNSIFDTEDEKIGGSRNGILDAGEDVGLDGIDKRDPPALNFPRKILGQDSSAPAVPYDFWDVNIDGIKNHDEPWSYDDWFYPELSTSYIQSDGTGSINGTQNSINNEGGRIPDTEDINGNGILDPANQYFSFSFSLAEDHPDTSLIVGGNPYAPGGAWKLYQIPFCLDEADFVVGNPSTSLIEYVRIWADSLEYNLKFADSSFPQFTRISIAEITLVSNE